MISVTQQLNDECYHQNTKQKRPKKKEEKNQRGDAQWLWGAIDLFFQAAYVSEDVSYIRLLSCFSIPQIMKTKKKRF